MHISYRRGEMSTIAIVGEANYMVNLWRIADAHFILYF